MTIKAMKLALEALENLQGLCSEEGNFIEQLTIWTPEAMYALRTAIETAEKPTGKQSLQVEQEPVAWYYEIDQSKAISFAPDRDPNIPWQPLYKHPAPVSDPVAWMVYTLDGQSVCVTDNPADFGESHRALPLYTTPPAAAQPAPVQEPVAEVKLKTTGGNVGIATVIHEIYSHYREPLRVGDKLYTTPPAAPGYIKGDTRSGLVDNDFEENT
jgi:hypothetical protein